MRIIGFLGIFALLGVAILGLLFAGQSGDWKGIVLMLFLVALLVFFARTLWRGHELERASAHGGRLAEGWLGESVTSFVRHQVLKSTEGIILVVGSGLSLLLSACSVIAPAAVGFTSGRGSANAVLFGMWPVLAFVFYVKICGPRFVTSVFSVFAMLAVVFFPFVIAYK